MEVALGFYMSVLYSSWRFIEITKFIHEALQRFMAYGGLGKLDLGSMVDV